MIVAFDTNCLIRLNSRKAAYEDDRARLEHLMDKATSAGGRIVIPAPAFAEFLVGIDESAAEWLMAFEKKRGVLIAPFDKRCAFEAAQMDKAALNAGNKKAGRTDPWQRIKIDRQIVAVARVNGAELVVSHDPGLRATAKLAGLQTSDFGDLDLPAEARQQKLFTPDSPSSSAGTW